MKEQYKVETLLGCKVIYGSVPVQVFVAINRDLPANAIMDTVLAKKIGATIVAGTPEDIAKLRLKNLPDGPERSRELVRATEAELSEEATRWISNGERGMSSEAIFSHLLKFPLGESVRSHPHDPDDLRRCLLLLEQVPEIAPLLSEMAEVSPKWAALIDSWGTICATFEKEAPRWREDIEWSAPNTYKIMQKVLDKAGTAVGCGHG